MLSLYLLLGEVHSCVFLFLNLKIMNSFISLKKNKLRIVTTKRKSVKASDIHYFLHFFLALLC